jgi:GT2 family glycosyltransferase
MSGVATSRPSRPDVSIVIPSWNGRHLLEPCLASLDALDHPGDAVERIVFDNGSSDDTVAWLAQHHPRVRILRSPRNLGFAEACNRAVAAARAELVCLLNNDVRVTPDWLRELLAARAATGAACVGSRVLTREGETVEFDGGTMNFHGHGAPYRHGVPASELAGEREPRPTLFACGAAMLVDREVFLRAGGFDESYFAYYEDVDLGWRLWALGHSSVVAPAARVFHLGQGSEAALGAGGRTRLLERNALLTIYKNYEPEIGDRVFACALALLSERARLEPSRADACREGLLSALAVLPAAERGRAAVNERRVRRDREILPLFVEPWRPVVGGPEYAALQSELAHRFGIDRHFPAAAARSGP